MALINFKEIPPANTANGEQDQFELFAREFLNCLGFNILVDPDRGQDGGRDLIVSEKRSGILGDTDIKWLVSCKHKAHSGKSVLATDEEDIVDRIVTHGCHGFIGFYSTVVSSPLGRKIEKLKENYEVETFDNEKIERILISNNVTYPLIKRFFPESSNEMEMKTPSNLLDEYMPMKCDRCGKDLLHRDVLDKYGGVIAFVSDRDFSDKYDYDKTKYVDIYYACKGVCDKTLERYHYSLNHSNGWEDISDLVIPYKLLQFYMAIVNRIRDEHDVYTDEAFEKMKGTIIALSQIAMKNQSPDDIKRIKSLSTLPKGL